MDGHGGAALGEAVGNRAGHRLGAVPHRLVDEHGLAPRAPLGPLGVAFEDPADLLGPAPDGAVVGGDHVDREPQLAETREGLLHDGGEGEDDVGVVLRRLLLEDVGRQLVGETLNGREVHPEGVLGEQDPLAREVGDHAVGPVEHFGLAEGERVVAEVELFEVADDGDGDVPVEVGLESGDTGLRGEDLLGSRGGDRLWETAGVVHLGVVGDDVVDPVDRQHRGDAGEHLGDEGAADGVDQHDLVRDDEVRVVGGAATRAIAVEVAERPVDGAHPVDAIGDLHCLECMCHGSASSVVGARAADTRARGRALAPVLGWSGRSRYSPCFAR